MSFRAQKMLKMQENNNSTGHNTQHLDINIHTVRKQEIIPLLLNCLNTYSPNDYVVIS